MAAFNFIFVVEPTTKDTKNNTKQHKTEKKNNNAKKITCLKKEFRFHWFSLAQLKTAAATTTKQTKEKKYAVKHKTLKYVGRW